MGKNADLPAREVFDSLTSAASIILASYFFFPKSELKNDLLLTSC